MQRISEKSQRRERMPASIKEACSTVGDACQQAFNFCVGCTDHAADNTTTEEKEKGKGQ